MTENKDNQYPRWDTTTVYDRSDFDVKKSESAFDVKRTHRTATSQAKKKTSKSFSSATPEKKTPEASSYAGDAHADQFPTFSRVARRKAEEAGQSKKSKGSGLKAIAAGSSAGAAQGRTTGRTAGKAANKSAGETTSEKQPPSRSRTANKNGKKTKKKKNLFLRFLKGVCLLILAAILIGGGAGFYYVYNVISNTPPIDPSDISTRLSETSVMYDAKGNEMDVLFFGTNREMASIHDMPKHLTDAFIAIEDKTFRTHHGFNITRIIGAILESLRGGDRISGTSTITQQLARNIYLQDKQFDYDIKRKIAEAYYSLKIEKTLSKDEIIEAYLNTIYFGFGASGVQTAAQAYFKKDVNQLTLAESAALAALPQLPDTYQLVTFIEGGSAATYGDLALKETEGGVYVINDVSRERRRTVLALMLEQELITQAEYDRAIKVELKDMINPDFTSYSSGSYSSYFADYVISDVIKDLQNEKGMDYSTAWNTVYQGGLTIYSTMDPEVQQIVTDEFANPSNYPTVNPTLDGNGNVIDENGYVIMYNYDNVFDEDGNYTMPTENFERLADGRMLIYYGRFLNIYVTDVGGTVDYSLEFPSLFDYDENWDYYTIAGGFINVPQNYKTANSDGDLIISADFFKDYPNFFRFNEDGTCTIPATSYSLGSKTIQPQAAMTIIENNTGHIIAMCGGRGTSGRQIFNRAISPRQSGSSIKPLGVYSAALQQSVEEMRNGEKHTFVNYGIDKQGAKLYGDYMTPASIVVDEKTTINGETWPYNDDQRYSGAKTLRQAMIDSINTCAVKIWFQVGLDYSLQNVKNFGITTLVEEGDTNDLNVAALALGGLTNGVTTLEMASAYSVFPNNGVRYEPSSYTKVLDRDGNVLLNNNPEPQQVLDPGVAWIMADIMHGVVTSGTGTSANIYETFIGGKTGTTDDEYDIWFDGFSNNYSASLWIGSDVNARLGSKSYVAAAMWRTIMSQLDGTYLGERAPMPNNVIVYNGEYFVDGTETGTQSISQIQKSVKICKETNLLATPKCEDTESKEYLTYDEEAVSKIPKEYCYIHNDDPEAYPTTEEGRKYIEEEQKKKEEEEKKKKEEEEKKKAEEEAKKKAEEEAKKAEEEAKKAAEEEARKAAEEEARKAAEEEARKAAEEEARKAAEEEARKAAEEEARKAAEEEARKAAEEEARKAAEEEAQKAAEEAQQGGDSEGSESESADDAA